MRFFVLDLEWNISGKKQSGEEAEDQDILHEEIIEIGAVRLNSEMEPADRFSLAVKPRYHKKMHAYVGRLIRRESESLKEGLPFPAAVKTFYDWCGPSEEETVYCTWSKSDVTPWLSNLEHYKIKPPQPPVFLDVQRLFSEAEGNPGLQRSVAYALEYFSLPLTEPFHRAVNDAYYTALIFEETLKRLTEEGRIPQDPRGREAALKRLSFDPELNYKSRIRKDGLASLEEAEEYLEGLGWTCPVCERELEALKAWRPQKRTYKRRTESGSGSISTKTTAPPKRAKKPGVSRQI